MSKVILKKIIEKDDIKDVSDMAYVIWREHYSAIISKEQIEYMLEKFQSPSAIADAISDGYEYYFITTEDENVGYVGIKTQQDKLFLSKIYILATYRGKGFAYEAVNHLCGLCKQRGLNAIWLTVNKNNSSVQRYERIGFKIVDTLVSDIQDGFVMDDYVMQKQV